MVNLGPVTGFSPRPLDNCRDAIILTGQFFNTPSGTDSVISIKVISSITRTSSVQLDGSSTYVKLSEGYFYYEDVTHAGYGPLAAYPRSCVQRTVFRYAEVHSLYCGKCTAHASS